MTLPQTSERLDEHVMPLARDKAPNADDDGTAALDAELATGKRQVTRCEDSAIDGVGDDRALDHVDD